MAFKFFVYYDEEGNITSITNEKRSSGDFIEAEENEISDFLNGSKDFTKFKIQSLGSGTKQIKLTTETSISIYKDFYEISKATGKEQVIIFHNSKKSSWDIKLDDQAKLVEFSFYICKKDNLNFLFREIKVPAKKISSIPFIVDLEEHNEDFIVLTKKIHDSYGIDYA